MNAFTRLQILTAIAGAALLTSLATSASTPAMPTAARVHFAGLTEPESCTGPQPIGAGAKNVVFSCSDHPDEVRRVSFAARFETLQGTRDSATVAACTIETEVLRQHFEDTLRYLKRPDFPCCHGLIVTLEDAIFVLQARQGMQRDTLDLVSNRTWLDEQRGTAMAAATGLSMGTNIPLSALRQGLPIHEDLMCDSKAMAGLDMKASSFVMVVERQVQHSTSVARAVKKGIMDDEDIAVFAHGWLSGQLDLFDSTGQFHTDAHPANILINTSQPMTFIWNDFGRTTSLAGHPDLQWGNTVSRFADVLDKCNFHDVREIARRLKALPHPMPDVDWAVNLRKEFSILNGLPLSRDVLSRLGGRSMGTRVAELEEDVVELRKEIKNQGEEIKDQREQIKNQNTRIDDLVIEMEALKAPADKKAPSPANEAPSPPNDEQ